MNFANTTLPYFYSRSESTGVSARFMIAPAFVGKVRRRPVREHQHQRFQLRRLVPAGYYRDDCDTDGNCRTVWTCP